MNATKSLFVAAAAFAGGYLAGLMLAPYSGERNRRIVRDKLRAQSRWFEAQFATLEGKVEAMEQQVEHLGHEIADAAHKTVEHFVPSLPDDPDAFHIERKDVAKDLRRMPKR